METHNTSRSVTVLVTGAAGLIGAELCDQLHQSGYHVIAVDDFSRSNTIPKCSEFYQKDLTYSLDFLIDQCSNIDIIYHLAAINGTANFYSRPNQVLANNIRMDLNVFEFAKQCTRLKRIFYASSSEVMAHENFCTETNKLVIDNVANPRYSYKLAKVAAENYLHNSNLPWIILRYFNVYGINTKQGHMVYDQIINHKRGIFNIIGPEETRCYTYVSDAIDATLNVSTCCAIEQTINIGSDDEMSTKTAVEIIAEELGATPTSYNIVPGLKGSPQRRRPDISTLLKQYPTYSPMSFREGIRKILNYEQSKRMGSP